MAMYLVPNEGGSNKKKSEDKVVKKTEEKVASSAVKPTTTTPQYSYWTAPSTQSAPAVSTPTVTQENVDNSAYAKALEAAEAARQNAPSYAGTYDSEIADLAARLQAPGSFDDQIAELYAKINNRDAFSYDLNGDAFWQQYKDKFTQSAKSAMRDTMGQAAALTGGYGSSYAQSVGQQAYDRRMEELMDIAPELYQMAYQRYQDEGTDLEKRLNLARDMASDESDALLQQLSVARQLASDEYNRYSDDYDRWYGERAYSDERLAAAQKQQQNNLAFLQSLLALGYTPTAQEIADAGLTQAQYAVIAAQYAPKESYRGGGGGKANTGSALKTALENINAAQLSGQYSNQQIIEAVQKNKDLTTAEKNYLVNGINTQYTTKPKTTR